MNIHSKNNPNRCSLRFIFFLKLSQMMKKYCLALDLVDDKDLINEYKKLHEEVWPEIKEALVESGVHNMEIYHTANRLFMILETRSSFSWTKKKKIDSENHKVQEWENLMWNYQKQIPGGKPGEKWVLMDKIFELRG